MHKKLRAWLVFLIFINGYISLSLELVILRQLSFYVGSSAVITSIIMGSFLGFMSLGYFVGESKRIKKNRIKLFLATSFIIIALFAMLSASFSLINGYFNAFGSLGIMSGVVQTFIFSGMFLSVGPFLFGLNTTLLSRTLHRYSTNYTGNIMAWDTIGSVIASLATTLVLMPLLGVNYTVILVVVMSLISALIVLPRVSTVIMGLSILIPTIFINSNSYQRTQHGILVNNANSTISVSDAGFEDMRMLNMNGLPMSLYSPRSGRMALYIEYINDIYLYTLPPDKTHKILILGAGGFTAGMQDERNDYTFVDIEHTLRDVSEKHFLGKKLTPNKKFIVQDASQFLKNTPDLYDVILLDVYSNSYQIPEGLISAEFMQRIKSRVATNGVIIMNMVVSASFRDNFSRVFDNTFRTVFPHNATRQIIGYVNPWDEEDIVNVLYIFTNRDNTGRIYTINKTPIIYDRQAYVK